MRGAAFSDRKTEAIRTVFSDNTSINPSVIDSWTAWPKPPFRPHCHTVSSKPTLMVYGAQCYIWHYKSCLFVCFWQYRFIILTMYLLKAKTRNKLLPHNISPNFNTGTAILVAAYWPNPNKPTRKSLWDSHPKTPVDQSLPTPYDFEWLTFRITLCWVGAEGISGWVQAIAYCTVTAEGSERGGQGWVLIWKLFPKLWRAVVQINHWSSAQRQLTSPWALTHSHSAYSIPSVTHHEKQEHIVLQTDPIWPTLFFLLLCSWWHKMMQIWIMLQGDWIQERLSVNTELLSHRGTTALWVLVV